MRAEMGGCRGGGGSCGGSSGGRICRGCRISWIVGPPIAEMPRLMGADG